MSKKVYFIEFFRYGDIDHEDDRIVGIYLDLNLAKKELDKILCGSIEENKNKHECVDFDIESLGYIISSRDLNIIKSIYGPTDEKIIYYYALNKNYEWEEDPEMKEE